MPKPRNREKGNLGERAARYYLEKKGLRLLETNWSCKLGELDLIMQDPEDDTRVIVEVRLRQTTSYGQGEETVAWQKQRKIIRATKAYMQAENYWGNVRFDVVSLEDKGERLGVMHVKNAFGE